MIFKGIIFFCLSVISTNAFSWSIERIVVTGSRIDVFDSPAITIVKPADYLVQKVKLVNDTRDKTLRSEELSRTVKDLLKSANKKKNIDIAIGDEIIYPITLNNFQLDLFSGERPDTSVAYLYVKTPIRSSSKIDKTIGNIESFLSNAKVSGRTVIEKQGELVLSIINPEKYRDELLELIAEDLNKTVKIFGDKYSAEVTGVSQSLQWERSSISELGLFLEYDFTLISK
ncbi:hypothetical protein [Parashewanella tropica]|uniref:hypothetical protein n=1 Tax=Parashewanella tropica TaxID=2547970 RepID=UPI00105A2D42|nr:hypothetical protein [Parashewanella tropica]